jgi:XTP/dITP diphosphohydrolase
VELLIATRSTGKIREIRRILADVTGLVVRDLQELGIEFDPAEDELEPYDTFEENALSKARYFFERSGVPTVADDSGIEVDALGGEPGVRSKRFAPDRGLEGAERDQANNEYLVRRLSDVSPELRTARYVCVAVLVGRDRTPLQLRGEAPGVIIENRRGSGGFGYDPYVLDPGLGKTFAEMSGPEKDARSHRGDAFRALADVLQTEMSSDHEGPQ